MTPKYKHMSFEDRCVIQEFLNLGYSFSVIARRINKDRRTISREVLNHRFLKSNSSQNHLDGCSKPGKPPYVCNACAKKIHCRDTQYLYDAAIAHNEYHKVLVNERSHLKITPTQISEINDTIAPLMVHHHQSVNHVYTSHPELLPFSKATFYKYIDLGLFNVKNIDLARKVRYRVKKEYDYTAKRTNTSIKVGRFYSDFLSFYEQNPLASIAEMDTVIGTMGGKGGKCMLTIFLRQYSFMLIYLLPYKRAEYVNKAFFDLKETLGSEEFARIFEVILTDNGTEFSDPDSIEFDTKTGEKLSQLFYCNPNSSWQKGAIEKNHEFIRYILPKGTSFAGLSQDDCDLIASHINSVPRPKLNNLSPYEAALGFIGKDNMHKLRIQKIPLDDIDLTIRLIKR